MLDATLAFFRRVCRPPSLAKDTIVAYRNVFSTSDAREHVLPDLAEFCRAYTPLPSAPEELQRAEGRREVWLRIQAVLGFTQADLVAMLQAQPHVRHRDG